MKFIFNKSNFGFSSAVLVAILVFSGFASIAFGETVYHSADTNQDGVISRAEYERVEAYFNAGGYHCDTSTVDGYAPGTDTSAQNCEPHNSDYDPQNWKIELSELLRVIQFYNVGGYVYCPEENTEDGFCPEALVGGEDLQLEVGVNQNVFNAGETAVLNISVAGGQGPYTVTVLTPFGSRMTSGGSGPSFTFEDWLFYDSAGQEVDFIIRVTDNDGEKVVFRQTVAINR